MSRMSDLDLMVRSEGARTAEDFIALGESAQDAADMAEMVAASIPAPLVSVDQAKLIFNLRARAGQEVTFVEEDEFADGPHDFDWEDER